MAYTYSATASEVHPTHHATLTAGGVTVGFVLCDSNGQSNERAITVSPYPRTALKTQQGTGKYADLQGPYFVLAQDDFSGGRGNEEFERDDTRFFDSWNLDTTREGSVVLGGMPTYGTGYRNSFQHMPNSSEDYTWRTLALNNIYAARITTVGEVSVDKAELFVRKVGNPGNSLTVKLQTDSSGPSGNILKTIAISELSDTVSELAVFDWASVRVFSAATNYWITIEDAGTPTATDYWQVLTADTETTKTYYQRSTDGGTGYSGTAYYIYFRIIDTDTDFIAHFYDYKGQFYFATQPDGGGTPTVYMNGWRGACDANSDPWTTLIDATQDWTENALIGYVAKIVAGPGSNETTNWRTITDSASTTLTSTAWNVQHTINSDYVVLGSSAFTQLTTTGLTKPVTDVVSINNTTYFAQGASVPSRKHHEYNNVGTWTNNVWDNWWIYSHYFLANRDPVSGMVQWSGKNSQYGNDYMSSVTKSLEPSYYLDVFHSTVILDDLSDVWDVNTNVTCSDVGESSLLFLINNGVVTGVSVADAGSGYSVDDTLTLVQSGATGCTVTVHSIGGSGEVTGLHAISTAGTGYATGAKATTVDPAGGTDCTITVDSISSFGTGVMGYEDIDTYDVRYTKYVTLDIYTSVSMDAGDIQLVMDNNSGCSSPVFTVDIPQLTVNNWNYFELEYEPFDIANADEISSIGLQLATDKASTDNNGVIGIGLREGVILRANKTKIDIDSPITNMILYGDPEVPWILTEKSIGPIENDLYYPIPLKEMETVASEYNGRAACVGDVYLYFSMGHGVEQYYSGTLIDMGPDKDTGLPTNRQGPISFLLSYPGRLYAGIDGGASNYSSVMCYKGGGWHEVYRAPRAGLRIRSGHIQTLPDSDVQRLWFSMGSDVLWIPITKNPKANSGYCYAHEGSLTTSWIYNSMVEVNKTWKALKIFAEDVTSAAIVIKADYQTNTSSTWVEIGMFDTEPVEEIDIAATLPSAKRIRFRLRFRTDAPASTPVLKALAVEGISFVPVKYQYSFAAKLVEGVLDTDLLGDKDDTFSTVQAKATQLKTWADGGTPLTWRSNYSIIDNKTVVIDPYAFQPTARVADEQIEQHIVQLTAMEV